MTRLLSGFFLLYSSIYSISISSADGTTINLGQFRGKKLLIVNTASGSRFANQYGSLERLQQRYPDKIVIIDVPSNDFNHEPLDDSKRMAAKALPEAHSGYILTIGAHVKGAGISPLYNWLTSSVSNGLVDNPVAGDFTKFLVDEEGNLEGVFAGSVDPMDSVLQNAIAN